MHGESHRRRSDVTGSRAGEDRHRTAEEVSMPECQGAGTPAPWQLAPGTQAPALVTSVSRPFRFTFILVLAALGDRLWRPSAAGATRARRRRSAGRSSSSRSTRCAPITCRRTATRRSRRPRSTRSPPTASSSSARTRTRRRRCRRTRRSCPGRLPFETGVRDNVGFTREGRRAAAAADAARARLHDRRHRLGVRAAQGNRHRARGSTSSTARCRRARPSSSIGQVQRDGAASEAIAEHWLDSIGTSRAFLFLHLVRAAQAVRAAGSLRRVRAVRRRDRLHRRNRRPARAAT